MAAERRGLFHDPYVPSTRQANTFRARGKNRLKPVAMRENEGYEIRHNGVPRTFRDNRETAFEAARYAKSKARGEIIEIIDRSTGTKLIMFEDGRTG
jgi:hypothetical protein